MSSTESPPLWLRELILTAVRRADPNPIKQAEIATLTYEWSDSWLFRRALELRPEWLRLSAEHRLVLVKGAIRELIDRCEIRAAHPHPRRRRAGWEPAFRLTSVLDELVQGL